MSTLLIEGDKGICSGCNNVFLKNNNDDFIKECETCGVELKFVYVEPESTTIEPDNGSTNTNKARIYISLTQNYSILNTYKSLAQLFMVIYTAYCGYTLFQINDAYNAMKSYGGEATLLSNAIIPLILAYLIAMFSWLCIIKIIDFLFDLDKKTNL